MRRPLVCGNWKMNGTRASAAALAGGVRAALDEARVESQGEIQGEIQGEGGAQVALCPPLVLLDVVGEAIRGSSVLLGAQNVAREQAGAYTGEVAAEMLAEAGCSMVLVGHSERRQYYGESDAVVADKAARALEAGLVAVVCLGETLDERERGATETVVARQLDAVIERIGLEALAACVLAYEPVWAIGTGRTASPEEAGAVHAYLRQRVAEGDAQVAGGLRILYGGSVKSSNAGELFAMPDIDGGLIGGASLVADDFVAICRAAG